MPEVKSMPFWRGGRTTRTRLPCFELGEVIVLFCLESSDCFVWNWREKRE